MHIDSLSEYEKKFVIKLVLPKMLDLLPKFEHECKAPLQTHSCHPFVVISRKSGDLYLHSEENRNCLRYCCSDFKDFKTINMPFRFDYSNHPCFHLFEQKDLSRFRDLDPQRFDDLFTSLKIKHKAKKYVEQLDKSRSKAKIKQACSFTQTQQKQIAKLILKLVTSKSLLLTLASNKNPEIVDTSGQDLYDALSFFNINKERLLEALLNYNGKFQFQKKEAAAVRRWALAFSKQDKTAVGMLDEDPLVRILASKKYEKQTNQK
jgi:hypothetical protein